MANKNYARLKLASKTMSVEQIETAIEMPLKKVWRIGEEKYFKKGTKKQARVKLSVNKDSGGLIESGIGETLPLGTHVEKLVKKLDAVSEKILEFSKTNYVEFSCVVYWDEEGSPALFFEKEIVEKIGALGACFDIDLYLLKET